MNLPVFFFFFEITVCAKEDVRHTCNLKIYRYSTPNSDGENSGRRRNGESPRLHHQIGITEGVRISMQRKTSNTS
jgi:hypothetical protein